MEFGKKYGIKTTLAFYQILRAKDSDAGDVLVTMNQVPLGVIHTADDDAAKELPRLLAKEIGHVFDENTLELVRRKLFDSEE
jgi:hypothetical protein